MVWRVRKCAALLGVCILLMSALHVSSSESDVNLHGSFDVDVENIGEGSGYFYDTGEDESEDISVYIMMGSAAFAVTAAALITALASQRDPS